jgi:hypothetical protein
VLIAAVLVWFDESVASLERCVTSLAGVADLLVAVDGRWKMFPGSELYSPPEQAEAIRQSAAAATIECSVTQAPRAALISQVAKRNYALALAESSADWVLVIDGDEWVEACDAEALRGLLAAAKDVCEVSIRNEGRGVFQKRPAPRRRLYRADAGVTVELAHNGYRAGDGRWLNGDRDHVDLAASEDLSTVIGLAHDRDARSNERQRSCGFYYDVRAKVGAEEWAA